MDRWKAGSTISPTWQERGTSCPRPQASLSSTWPDCDWFRHSFLMSTTAVTKQPKNVLTTYSHISSTWHSQRYDLAGVTSLRKEQLVADASSTRHHEFPSFLD